MVRFYVSGRWAAAGWAVLLSFFLVATAWAQAGGVGQRYTLIGRVADASGQGLPGATVLLRGTTLGATSDLDGSYSIAGTVAPGDYALIFSAVGYRTETRPVTLGSATSITTNATLAESRQSLDEVVVVGSTVRAGFMGQ